jgi:hypothetical protein
MCMSLEWKFTLLYFVLTPLFLCCRPSFSWPWLFYDTILLVVLVPFVLFSFPRGLRFSYSFCSILSPSFSTVILTVVNHATVMVPHRLLMAIPMLVVVIMVTLMLVAPIMVILMLVIKVMLVMDIRMAVNHAMDIQHRNHNQQHMDTHTVDNHAMVMAVMHNRRFNFQAQLPMMSALDARRMAMESHYHDAHDASQPFIVLVSVKREIGQLIRPLARRSKQVSTCREATCPCD